MAQRLATAQQKHQPLPLAHRIDETLTIERAYDVQRQFVHVLLRDEKPAGFKAGLTTPAAQARFAYDAPVSGVLLAAPRRTPQPLALHELPELYIETEVAFRIAREIVSPLQSIEELRARVDGIAPAVELPTLHYDTSDKLTVVDLIATNVGATYFLTGEFASPQARDPNAASPRLVCNGEELNRGGGRDALGDQWQAALWLVNELVAHDWKLERGQILITGALGRMIKATPGECRADFQDWGTIGFRITP